MFFHKRGQVTIWIIIAVALVVSVVLFFTIDRDVESNIRDEVNPEIFIDRCVRQYTEEVVNIILPKGGFVEDNNSRVYNDIPVSFLCKNVGNYEPCINQHPMYLNEIKEEIRSYLDERVAQCFVSLQGELTKRNKRVQLGEQELKVSLGPDRVYVDVNREMTITSSNGQVQNIDVIEVDYISPLYNLALVANEIASQEAKFCYFEYVGYQVLYKRFNIIKHTMSDSTKIYTIKDKYTGKELNIATRSCAVPPGL